MAVTAEAMNRHCEGFRIQFRVMPRIAETGTLDDLGIYRESASPSSLFLAPPHRQGPCIHMQKVERGPLLLAGLCLAPLRIIFNGMRAPRIH
jgi:hypothetical protein